MGTDGNANSADGEARLNDRSTVRSVERAVDILLALADGSQSLGRVAEKIHLSKSTVHRLLTSLAHKHLVIQDSRTGEYMLGPGCIPLVEAMASGVGGLGVIARTLARQ
jgi:IclR family transcriptional regulator, KDG regulon repressor